MLGAIASILLSFSIQAVEAPQDSEHPGSLVYEESGFKKTEVQCSGQRASEVFLPETVNDQTPTVVFGHGQALNVSHYEESFEHFSKKGVAVIFPDYSRGFFDQNWDRMAKDYINQVSCALEEKGLNKDLVVFGGHSKGAYVASVAAGLAHRDDEVVKPKSLVLLNSAGFDSLSLNFISPDVEMTLVFSEEDNVVERSITKDIYAQSQSEKKQFILLKSYPETSLNEAVEAIHMWPLNKSFLFFGGGPIGPLHYYGMWKWFIGAAEDTVSGADGTNPYAYGIFADDKGPVDIKDDLIKSW